MLTGAPPRIISFGTLSIPSGVKEHLEEILESGRLTCGKYVRLLEEKFTRLLGVKEAVAVSSGTDADTLALATLHDCGASRGDEVIVPALSFAATGHAVLHAGFRPVFVDIERETLNIDPDQIEEAVTPRTRAVLAVHLMGKPAAMDRILRIARKHSLYVVEDAAEAHGAFLEGKPLGTLGDLGAFSLYAAHIISSVEGGMVVTDREDLADLLRSLRAHGRACKCRQCLLNSAQGLCRQRFDGGDGTDHRFLFERIGYSAKMNELEAAVGLGNLDLFPEILETRRRNLYYFLERFGRFAPYLASFREGPGEKISPHAFPIIVQEAAPFTREELAWYLEKNGIETRTLFASMPTQCPGFADLGYRPGQFPQAEYIGRNGLHLGVHQGLTLEDMDYVLDTIHRFLEEHQE